MPRQLDGKAESPKNAPNLGKTAGNPEPGFYKRLDYDCIPNSCIQPSLFRPRFYDLGEFLLLVWSQAGLSAGIRTFSQSGQPRGAILFDPLFKGSQGHCKHIGHVLLEPTITDQQDVTRLEKQIKVAVPPGHLTLLFQHFALISRQQ